MANYNYSNNRQQQPRHQGDRKQAIKNEQEQIVAYFKSEWIKNDIDKECVDFCEKVAKYLAEAKVSSSLLRNIYGELKRIEAKGFELCKTDFFLLRPKVAYTIVRNEKNDYAQLFNAVYQKTSSNTSNEAHFSNLVRMCEAIIAFHKTHNPK